MNTITQKKFPTSQHWQELKKLNSELISVEEFLQYYDLTKKELAKITGASYDSVRQWFSRSKRQPTGEQLLRLNMVFWKWQILEKKMLHKRWGSYN
jgi:DNA-binding transcriptional regulator YiaG